MNLNNYICTHSLYLTWGSSSTFNPDISYISLLSQINTQEGMVPYYFIMLKKMFQWLLAWPVSFCFVNSTVINCQFGLEGTASESNWKSQMYISYIGTDIIYFPRILLWQALLSLNWWVSSVGQPLPNCNIFLSFRP